MRWNILPTKKNSMIFNEEYKVSWNNENQYKVKSSKHPEATPRYFVIKIRGVITGRKLYRRGFAVMR